VPELFRALLPNPAEFTADKVGLFRLHQLSTQQWLDYCLAVRQGLLSADVTVVAVLWQQLSWRHHRLIRLKGGFGTPLAQRWQSGLQVCHLLSAWLGWRRYRRQSLVTADYAPALRTVLFGAGSGGRQALANLPAGFELVAVCDNNSKLHGSNFCGLPVISPQQLQQQQQDIDCIMVASTYFYEIKAKLTEELGLPAVKISRAPYAVITQPFPAGETATLSLVLLLAIALALSVLAALWLS
jgi:FlaA1/EpsC-like NDP-sugar epimerase